jgi:hypothetical protein
VEEIIFLLFICELMSFLFARQRIHLNLTHRIHSNINLSSKVLPRVQDNESLNPSSMYSLK